MRTSNRPKQEVQGRLPWERDGWVNIWRESRRGLDKMEVKCPKQRQKHVLGALWGVQGSECWKPMWLDHCEQGGGSSEMRLEGVVRARPGKPSGHHMDFGLYFKNNWKSLKCWKQANDRMVSVLQRTRFGCDVANVLEGPFGCGKQVGRLLK